MPPEFPPDAPAEVAPEPWCPPLELPEVLVSDLDAMREDGLSKFIMTGTVQSDDEGEIQRALIEADEFQTLTEEQKAEEMARVAAEVTQTGFEAPAILEATEDPLPAVLTVNDEPRDPLLDALPLEKVAPQLPPVGSIWAESAQIASRGVVELLSHSVVAPGWANVRYRNRNGHNFDGVCPLSQFETMIRIENWQGFAPVEFPPIGSYWRFAGGYTTIVRVVNYDGGDVRPIVCDYVPKAETSQMHLESDRFADGSLIRLSDEQGACFEMTQASDPEPPKVDQRTALFDIESRATSIASELQCRPAHVAVMVDTVLQTVEQLCTLRSVSQSSPVFAALRGLLASQPGQIFSEGIAVALDGPLKSIVQLEVDRIAQQFAAEVEESKKLYAQAYFGVKSKQDDSSFDSKEANPQLSATFADINSTLVELQKEIGRLDSRMDDIERARIAGENRKAKRYADAGKARRVPKAEALAGRRARDKTLRESKAREALDDIGLSEQPVKRGRGRPPKSGGGPAAKPAKAPPAAVKRGRGRPPKSAGGPGKKPAKAPPAAVKRGRGRPPKSAQVGDVPRSFSSVDLMNKIQKFIGKSNPKVQHLMSRIPATHLSKFLSAASRGMPPLDVMKLTTWTPSEQGAFAAWYFSDGAASR